MRTRVLSACFFGISAMLALEARADFPSIDARQFTPPLDPNGSLYLEPAVTPGPLAWNTAAWLGYAYRPAVLRDSSGAIVASLVQHQLFADLTANVGLGERLALGVDLPFLLYQTGDDTPVTRAVAGRTPVGTAFGDIALAGKANLVPNASLGGFGLSTLVRITLPTSPSASYVGNGTGTGELRLLGEYSLIALTLQATAGFALRGHEENVIQRTYGNAIPWGGAIVLRPQAWGWDDKGVWRWTAEVHGSALLPPSHAAEQNGYAKPVSPAMAGISARYAPGDVSFLLGVEAGLSKALGNPPVQAMLSVQWAPREHDRDHDGVPDDVDQCPELAEDRDGFQDADGCPDWDNDDDGVGDATDRCPAQKEDADGFQDEDGCPDEDNDRDGIHDNEDACPNEAGERRADPKANGCPDRDNDGIADNVDKCPNEPEDRDGYEDADGCPDLDDDNDGVPDARDQCPRTPAGPAPDPNRPGCPAADRDGDTFADSADKCPDQPESWNGVEDDDGCPDSGGKQLVTVTQKGTELTVRLSGSVKFLGSREVPEVDPSSLPILRALAFELNRHPTWIAAVGARPKSHDPSEEQSALARAFAAADALRRLTNRDGVAETVGFRAVESQPGAALMGFGVLLLAPKKEAPAR